MPSLASFPQQSQELRSYFCAKHKNNGFQPFAIVVVVPFALAPRTTIFVKQKW